MSRTRVTSAVSVLWREPEALVRLFPGRFAADTGRRGADQVGDVGVGGALAGFEVFGREPAVLVGGGALPLVQALEAHRHGSDRDSVEGLLLGDVVAAPGELDGVLRDRLAQALRLDHNAGLLVQLPDTRRTQRFSGVGRAADGEPEGPLRMMRIPAVQQQHASFVVDGQYPGGLAADGRRARGRFVRRRYGHGYSTIFEIGISRMSCAPAVFRAG